MEYKKTLLMPKTAFPMRGGLPNKEPKMQEDWAAMNLYEAVQEKMQENQHLFYMMDHLMQMARSIPAMQ